MKMKKQNKGITLIALVITVIVLLILAGAAVSIGLNGGDVFNRANQAKTGWNEKASQENIALSNYLEYFERNPNSLIVTATQAGLNVKISIEGIEQKSISEATKDEKLDAILLAMKNDGELPTEATKEFLKNRLDAYDYEELIELILEVSRCKC